jgi:hypothetical protein
MTIIDNNEILTAAKHCFNGGHFFIGEQEYILVYRGATVFVWKYAGKGNKPEHVINLGNFATK